jgi:hypothetical protein
LFTEPDGGVVVVYNSRGKGVAAIEGSAEWKIARRNADILAANIDRNWKESDFVSKFGEPDVRGTGRLGYEHQSVLSYGPFVVGDKEHYHLVVGFVADSSGPEYRRREKGTMVGWRREKPVVGSDGRVSAQVVDNSFP